MKQKDIFTLVSVGIFAAVVSAIISAHVFNSQHARNTKAPVVTSISGTLPDIKNDSDYKAIFNNNALDPTQLIKIGSSQNSQPFNNQ